MSDPSAIPQFHLYGEAADDQIFDFIHVEALRRRARKHGWVIEPHSHRYLQQIAVVGEGKGKVTIETGSTEFVGPTLIMLPPSVAHGFEFGPDIVGVIISFTDDVVRGKTGLRGGLQARLTHAQRALVIPVKDMEHEKRIKMLAKAMLAEQNFGLDGVEIALRGYLALLIVEIARIDHEDVSWRGVKPAAQNETIDKLLQLIEDNFRQTRHLSSYADWLHMTPDRLNELCKREAGVTAGHLIRQRLLTEAKRQLMFTELSVSEIAYDLNFSDPSYFSRFFRKSTTQTPQEFRLGRPEGRE